MSEVRQRTASVRVRLEPDELAAIREKAEQAGLSLSGFMRSAAMNRKIVAIPDGVMKGVENIGRAGGLLRLTLAMIDKAKIPRDLRPQVVEAAIIKLRQAAEAIAEEITNDL